MNEFHFQSHIVLAGVKTPCIVRATKTLTGKIQPYEVKAGSNVYPPDNWMDRLTQEANEYYDKQTEILARGIV